MAASTRELLADVCSPAVLRAVAEGRDAGDAARWERYCELGLPGLLAPESAGGVGLSNVDFVLIAEELGRAAVPEALVEHAAVGVPLLAEFAGELHVKPVLEAAAAGASRLAVVLPQEPFVAGAGEANWLVVGAGDELHLVPRSGVRLVEQPANDRLRRLHRVEYSPVPATRIATGAGSAGGLFARGRSRRAARGGPVSWRRRADARDRCGVCERSQAVRPCDRRLPGAQAPVRECAGQGRVRAPGRLRRRRVARGIG